MSIPLRSASVRKIGLRAQHTALVIQESLLALLQERAWSQITVVDVARKSGISPASLYQYYKSLDVLALATAERLSSEKDLLPYHLKQVVTLLKFEAANGLLSLTDDDDTA